MVCFDVAGISDLDKELLFHVGRGASNTACVKALAAVTVGPAGKRCYHPHSGLPLPTDGAGVRSDFIYTFAIAGLALGWDSFLYLDDSTHFLPCLP